MNKIILYTILISAIIISGCKQGDININQLQNNTGNTQKIVDNKEKNKISNNTGDKKNKTKDYHKKYSIQALSNRNFSGTNLELKNILRETNSYTRYYIEYKSNDLTISGIMNVPKGNGSFPVLILNHGYINPDVYTVGRGLKREQDYFARNGYIVLHPDYRNHGNSSSVESDEFDFGYTEDVINAVLAVKNSNLDFIDKNNIGMLGHSMGGSITLNLIASKPNLINAVSLYAPSSSKMKKNIKRWTIDERQAAKNADEFIEQEYNIKNNKQKFWKNISAANFLDKVNLPIILHHGTNDKSVPIEWSNELSKILKNNSINFNYYKYKNGKHEFIGETRNKFMERNLEFFNKNLKN